MRNSPLHQIAVALLACPAPVALNAGTPPKAGDKAAEFVLKTLDAQTVRLSDLTAKG